MRPTAVQPTSTVTDADGKGWLLLSNGARIELPSGGGSGGDSGGGGTEGPPGPTGPSGPPGVGLPEVSIGPIAPAAQAYDQIWGDESLVDPDTDNLPTYLIKPDGTRYQVAGTPGPPGTEGPAGPAGEGGGYVIVSDTPPTTSPDGTPLGTGQGWLNSSIPAVATQCVYIMGNAIAAFTGTGAWAKPPSMSKIVFTAPCDGVVVVTGYAGGQSSTAQLLGCAIGSNLNAGAEVTLGGSGHYINVAVNERANFPLVGQFQLAAGDILKLFLSVKGTGSITITGWTFSIVFDPWAIFQTISI